MGAVGDEIDVITLLYGEMWSVSGLSRQYVDTHIQTNASCIIPTRVHVQRFMSVVRGKIYSKVQDIHPLHI